MRGRAAALVLVLVDFLPRANLDVQPVSRQWQGACRKGVVGAWRVIGFVEVYFDHIAFGRLCSEEARSRVGFFAACEIPENKEKSSRVKTFSF